MCYCFHVLVLGLCTYIVYFQRLRLSLENPSGAGESPGLSASLWSAPSVWRQADSWQDGRAAGQWQAAGTGGRGRRRWWRGASDWSHEQRESKAFPSVVPGYKRWSCGKNKRRRQDVKNVGSPLHSLKSMKLKHWRFLKTSIFTVTEEKSIRLLSAEWKSICVGVGRPWPRWKTGSFWYFSTGPHQKAIICKGRMTAEDQPASVHVLHWDPSGPLPLLISSLWLNVLMRTALNVVCV